MPPDAVRWFADHVGHALINAAPPAWSGRRVFLIGGTTLILAHEPELREKYPAAANQHGRGVWPVVLLVVAPS